MSLHMGAITCRRLECVISKRPRLPGTQPVPLTFSFYTPLPLLEIVQG